LTPFGVQRLYVVGETDADVHLLVEFAAGVAPPDVSTWLRLQREVGRACARRIELITVDGLLSRVAEEDLGLTLLFDASQRGSEGESVDDA
jgi:hypothetical protein